MGDSNIRNCYVKEIFDKNLKHETIFIQTSTKEALISTVEKQSKINNATIFHCSWMNEIVSKTRGKDDAAKDKEIPKLIKEIIESLFKVASEKTCWNFVVMKPIRRKMPSAFDNRAGKIDELITEAFYNIQPPNNIKLKGAPDLEDKHYLADGVHLNKDGYLILQTHVIEQISLSIQEDAFLNDDDEVFDFQNTIQQESDMEVEPAQGGAANSGNLRPTQQILTRTSARNKRVRELEDAEENENTPSHKTQHREDRMDAILLRMEAIMEVANTKVDINTKQIDLNTIKIQSNHLNLKTRLDSLDLTIARIKEENDVSENERMRDTVIIKKFVLTETVTTKAQDLVDLVKKLAADMIKEIMGKDLETRFIGLAFPVEPTRMAEKPKEVPPFRIQFRNREDALDFKSKAIDLAKKPNGTYSGIYLVHPHNAATRIRISILWILAKALKDVSIEAWVAQSTSRPLLMVKKTQYPKGFGFVQAILEHENFIEKCDFTEPNKLANRFFRGETQRLFIVLNDEQRQGKTSLQFSSSNARTIT